MPVEIEGSVSICALNTLPCAYVVFYGPMRKCMINGFEWARMNIDELESKQRCLAYRLVVMESYGSSVLGTVKDFV